MGSLGGVISINIILSVIFSIFLTRLSSFKSDEEEEGSSLIVTLLYVLSLALLANKLASNLTTLFCISLRVVGSLSLNG